MSAAQQGFVEVCRLDALVEDQPFVAVVDGIDVVLVNTCGAVHAMHNACSHADVALSEGEVDDCHIECWMHGSRFDLRTGIPDSLPATRPVPVYAVHLEGEGPEATVFVNPHAPAAVAAAITTVLQEG